MSLQHLVYFSGGVGSWMAARRVAAAWGTRNLTLMFADVLMEDEDLYRFIEEAADDIGAPITRVSREVSPWDLFRKEKFIGNTRADICSRKLKRDLLNKTRNLLFDPASTIVYFGIDWTEENRLTGRHGKGGLLNHPDHKGWTLRAPLCEVPRLTKDEMLAHLKHRGIQPPRLYALGFPHNNCGGFCIKAGQAHFAHLLKTLPERYRWHEQQEEELRTLIGKDVAIMRRRPKTGTVPLTMREFRERIEAREDYDKHEWGGCGCAL